MLGPFNHHVYRVYREFKLLSIVAVSFERDNLLLDHKSMNI